MKSPEPVEIVPTPAEEALEILREQTDTFRNWAFALALRLGMGPEEAAGMFWDGLPKRNPDRTLGAEEVGQIARAVASFMTLTHREVALWQEDAAWHIALGITDDILDGLERWGVPVGFWAAWIAEMERREGEHLGMDWRTWTEGNTLRMRLGALR